MVSDTNPSLPRDPRRLPGPTAVAYLHSCFEGRGHLENRAEGGASQI